MKIDRNDEGIFIFGVVVIAVSIFIFIVGVECMEATDNRMTLLDIYENGDGLWVDEDSGEIEIYSAEDCQIGETREFNEEGLSVLGLLPLLFVGVAFLVIGLFTIWTAIKGN